MPPVIGDKETVQQKMDMLHVLGDIEIAQNLMKEKEAKEEGMEEVDHPITANYKMLHCDLTPLKKEDEEYKWIENYTYNTKGRNLTIEAIFKVPPCHCPAHPSHTDGSRRRGQALRRPQGHQGAQAAVAR